jgi:hypothetical protein
MFGVAARDRARRCAPPAGRGRARCDLPPSADRQRRFHSVRGGAEQQREQALLDPRREVSDHPEIDESQPRIMGQKHISGMRVGVEEAVDDDLMGSDSTRSPAFGAATNGLSKGCSTSGMCAGLKSCATSRAMLSVGIDFAQLVAGLKSCVTSTKPFTGSPKSSFRSGDILTGRTRRKEAWRG